MCSIHLAEVANSGYFIAWFTCFHDVNWNIDCLPGKSFYTVPYDMNVAYFFHMPKLDVFLKVSLFDDNDQLINKKIKPVYEHRYCLVFGWVFDICLIRCSQIIIYYSFQIRLFYLFIFFAIVCMTWVGQGILFFTVVYCLLVDVAWNYFIQICQYKTLLFEWPLLILMTLYKMLCILLCVLQWNFISAFL